MFSGIFSGLLFIISFVAINSHQTKNILRYSDLTSYRVCTTDADCLDNSFCFGNDAEKTGRCKCLQGFEMLVRNEKFYACLQESSYGNPCLYSEQCVINLGNNGLCDAKTKLCTCADGSHYNEVDKQCYKSKKLHDICTTSAECVLKNGQNAFCQYGRCRCDLNQQPTASLDECLDSKRLGDTCGSDKDCQLIDNSYCGGTCLCRQGFSVCRHGDFCLKDAITIGEDCTEDIQCVKNIPHAFCLEEKKCVCPLGRHFYGSSCIVSVDVDGYCEKDFQCLSQEKEVSLVCKHDVCVKTNSGGLFLYSVILLFLQVGFIYILNY
ncbi:unnamed protein product [Brassicogethes aeneus]|uniref:EB domain-containing protein n=1 Tax=Brassicogethes aeneus TaxID=1431903 RepID=A0A9P0B7M9_BRAAE|nr:unnamed protein product [Brassicogethes aeneus]